MAIELIDTIKPKNGGSFPIVEIGDVGMPDGTKLDKALPTMIENYVEEYINEALGGDY
jgi:hypothetical protein